MLVLFVLIKHSVFVNILLRTCKQRKKPLRFIRQRLEMINFMQKRINKRFCAFLTPGKPVEASAGAAYGNQY